MARVIAICNQKGGVGKTTTAVNLSAYLAMRGKRTLLVDFDPQANASSALGASPSKTEASIYHGILNQILPQEVVRPSRLFDFHFIPSAPHLAGALIELVNVPEREYFLRKFLNHLRHGYDYIFIDLPPSLSLLTVNGLVAADEVLIPVQAEYYSLQGLSQLLETVDLIRANMRHDVKVAGALLTMFDVREKLARDVERDLRTNFPHRVFATVIPRSSPLAEAPSFSKPIVLHRPDSPGAVAYANLADEMIREDEARMASSPSVNGTFGNFHIPDLEP